MNCNKYLVFGPLPYVSFQLYLEDGEFKRQRGFRSPVFKNSQMEIQVERPSLLECILRNSEVKATITCNADSAEMLDTGHAIISRYLTAKNIMHLKISG